VKASHVNPQHHATLGLQVPVVRSRDREPISAIDPEQVDTIAALSRLGKALPDFCRRAILGEVGSTKWAELSDILQAAARVCREHVVIDVHDVGDSGSR